MSFTQVFLPRIRRFRLGDPRIDSIQRRPKKEDQGAILIQPGRKERSLELYIYIVGGDSQVEDPRGDRFDSERGIQVDGSDSTGSD